MLFHFGIELLDKLDGYYGSRYQQARAQGYLQSNSKYYWLYVELELRVKLLRQARMFLDALPQYLIQSGWEPTLGYVVEYTGEWFSEKMLGVLPRDDAGRCTYLSDENPYWNEVQEVTEELNQDSVASVLPLFQITLVEYVVRSIRLYFYLREKQFKAIDREKFNSVMSLDEKLGTSA
jgi:hypothetical protein